jgi:hypothetical protein
LKKLRDKGRYTREEATRLLTAWVDNICWDRAKALGIRGPAYVAMFPREARVDYAKHIEETYYHDLDVANMPPKRGGF